MESGFEEIVTELLKIFSPNLTQPYMGHTGYSTKENVNNIEITHLHWGLQLIFDESQREGNNEIWVDVYALTRFLAKHTQPAVKVEGTKEWARTNGIVDPAVEEYEEGEGNCWAGRGCVSRRISAKVWVL